MTKKYNEQWLTGALEEAFGEIVFWEEECLLVFHMSVRTEESALIPKEYYIVDIDTPAISTKAKQYGRPIRKLPKLLSYSMDDAYSGHKIIAYEIWRYKVQNHHLVDAGESFREFALFAAEYHPDYFGAFPAPIITPHGYTVRYQTMDNGIYYVETDEGKELIAFCMPLWEMFSGYTSKVGKHAVYDTSHGLVEEEMYMFFAREQSCLPFFELWPERPAWKVSPVFNYPAMMNAIWSYFPNYVAAYNTAEQRGMHSIETAFLGMNMDIDLEANPEHMITFTPDAGIEFLNI